MSPTPAPLQRALVAWYAEVQRDLPWRRTRDPYLIWLSEVMLQQTRVEVVINYWERFAERFPTLADLARADEDEVLALWSGLGYYRRARGLLATAREVVAKHGGALPADGAALRALPGFGPYTAGAVGSIAFGLPLPLVDGNVARVLSRLFLVDGFVDSGRGQRKLWQLAEAHLLTSDPGTWNQALMELGATICKPKHPRCDACPVADLCAARAHGVAAELPKKRPKPAPLAVKVEALVAQAPPADPTGEPTFLLAKRPATGRNRGLFEGPLREASEPARDLWPAAWAHPLLAAAFARATPAAPVRHSITRHRITVDVRHATFTAAQARQITHETHYALVPNCALDDVALSGLAAKLMRAN